MAFEDRFNDFKESQEKQHQSFVNQTQESMKIYVKIPEKDVKFEASAYSLDYEHSKKNQDLDKPRMFSMNQIRELYYLHSNRSQMKELTSLNTKDLIKVDQQLQVKEKEDLDQKTQHQKNITKLNDDIQKIMDTNTEFKNKTSVQAADIYDKLTNATNNVKQSQQMVKGFQSQMSLFQERQDAFRVNISNQQDLLTYRIKELEQNVRGTQKQLEDGMSEMQTKIYDQFQEQTDKFNDIILNTKDIILSEVQEELITGEQRVTDLKSDIQVQFDDLMESIERKFSKEKTKQETLNLNFDNRLKDIRREIKIFKEIAQKITSMAQYKAADPLESKLKEKTSEAKYFSLEVALKEQDKDLKAQINQLKDCFKKMMTTLEQAQIQQSPSIPLETNNFPINASVQVLKSTSRLQEKSQQPLSLPQIEERIQNQNEDQPQMQSLYNQEFCQSPQVKDVGIQNSTIYYSKQEKRQPEGLCINNSLNHMISSSKYPFQHQQTIQNLELRIFDNIFYQRLNHIKKALEIDPLEIDTAKNFFLLLSQSKKQVQDNEKQMIEKIKQKHKLDNKQAVKGGENRIFNQLKSTSTLFPTSIEQSLQKNKPMITQTQFNNFKYGQKQTDANRYHSLQNSPINVDDKRNFNNQSQMILETDQEIKINNMIEKRRDSLSKKLNLNNSAIIN